MEPKSERKDCICNNVPCMLRGSEELNEHVECKYGIKPAQATAGGKFTSEEAECLEDCRHAPAVLVEKRSDQYLSAETLGTLIEGLE